MLEKVGSLKGGVEDTNDRNMLEKVRSLKGGVEDTSDRNTLLPCRVNSQAHCTGFYSAFVYEEQGS